MREKFSFRPEDTGENRCAPRAFYLPRGTADAALSETPDDRYLSLNGEWSFRYFETLLDLPESPSEIEYTDTLPVPSCWQCHGYGKIQYTNINRSRIRRRMWRWIRRSAYISVASRLRRESASI